MIPAAAEYKDTLRADWEKDGFVRLERLIGQEDIAQLRAAYDDILEKRIDCGAVDDRMLGGVTRQIKFPDRHHPVFRDNAALSAGRALASVVLDCPEPLFLFSMLIFKPPGHTVETPWHQDMAYNGMPFAPAGSPIPTDQSVQIWVAIDAADEENGCMHFIAGRHHDPLLPHVIASGDPQDEGRLLAIADPAPLLQPGAVRPCPLPAGGCTGHSLGTPHFTPGNRSKDRPRRAYIFNFANPDGAKAAEKMARGTR